MKALRIYVDTSVIGGCFDPEFGRWSLALMEDFRKGRFRPVLSDVTESEILPAPEPVRKLWDELFLIAEFVETTAEVKALVEVYLSRRVLGVRWRNDLLQIALATVADADLLVSWNFKHIVRQDLIPRLGELNLGAGYRPVAIYSPREVSRHGKGIHH